MVCLYIDDIRNPPAGRDWDIVRNSSEAMEYVLLRGLPSHASFDHDLGGDDTVMKFIKWLIEYDMDHNGTIIPNNFTYDVHSSNPPGVDNIRGLLDSYIQFKVSNNK